MITQQMLDYIRQQSAAGKSQEEMKAALRQSGWQEADIEEGIRAFSSGQTAAPTAPASALPKASQILSEAWNIYKQKWTLFVSILAVPTVLVLAWTIAAHAAGLTKTGNFVIQNSAFTLKPEYLPLEIISILVAAFLYLWAAVSQLVAVRDRGETLTFSQVFSRSLKHILPFLGTGILVGLAVAGGFILLIIPGIIFGLWFSQSNYVVVAEGLAGSKAMSQSRSYVRGRLWTVFGKFFFIGIISWAISFIIALGFNQAHNQIVGAIGSALVNIFWAPVVAVYGYLLYEYLKKTRA